MHEFSVWAPKPETVRLDVDGTVYPMTRARDGWWRVTVDAAPDARYGLSARRRSEASARPALTAPARRRAPALAVVGARAAGMDGRRLVRTFCAGCGDLRAAHRHVHPRRHF